MAGIDSCVTQFSPSSPPVPGKMRAAVVGSAGVVRRLELAAQLS